MASDSLLNSTQMASSESLETNNDLISIMPVIVTDKILKHLPLTIAAKTSILSRTWRRIWLSCPYLTFDEAFWDGLHKANSTTNWQKGSLIISKVLSHHNGRVHSFHLELKPSNADLQFDKNASLSQWLSLLSRTPLLNDCFLKEQRATLVDLTSDFSAQMASSESLESVETNNDLISTMPVIVTDKILKQVPLTIAAKTSILSRTWRRIWLSCPYLVFDGAFWDGFSKLDDSAKWHKGSNIISSVLFHHNGRVDSFYLELRQKNADLLVHKNASLSQWLSLFSRTCPRKIFLLNCAGKWSNLVIMPSHIFHCNELVKLRLQCIVLNAPPFDFKGFPHLKRLELISIKFNNGIDMLWSLIAKCPCLVFLKLDNCLGMDVLDIDAPSLETLIINGRFGSLRLKRVPRLISVLLCSTKSEMSETKTAVASINSLASSCELQCLVIEGNLPKFLAAGGINKSLPLAFNHLENLCLKDLTLTDTDVFRFSLGMLQSCPFIKNLKISITSTTDAVQDKYEYPINDYKLGRLHTVKIKHITGSNAELKLIEYVLAISVVLEKLFFKCEKLDAASELKVLRQLIRLPRASAKAQFISLGE